ncbi:MAG: transcriptional regulator [Hyphomicrobiales bacterium]|nr:transcriptional regulator [Hyphomicrobiales bacterium]
MTPFGQKLRAMRADRGITLKAMAEGLGVSAAYLSALEHGRRGAPTWYLVQRIITFFNVIWDEAEEIERLAQISHPRVVVDTSGLGPLATEFANTFARRIGSLSDGDIRALMDLFNERLRHADRRPKS